MSCSSSVVVSGRVRTERMRAQILPRIGMTSEAETGVSDAPKHSNRDLSRLLKFPPPHTKEFLPRG